MRHRIALRQLWSALDKAAGRLVCAAWVRLRAREAGSRGFAGRGARARGAVRRARERARARARTRARARVARARAQRGRDDELAWVRLRLLTRLRAGEDAARVAGSGKSRGRESREVARGASIPIP